MWVIRGNSMTKYQNYYALLKEDIGEVVWVSDKTEATLFSSEQDALKVMGLIRSRKKRMCVEPLD